MSREGCPQAVTESDYTAARTSDLCNRASSLHSQASTGRAYDQETTLTCVLRPEIP